MKKLLASLVATMLVVVASACGGEPDSAGRAQINFDASVGCDERMDKALTQWAERGAAFSVVDLGSDRQCVGAYGLADQETKRPNTPETVFSIGSITKPITAAAIYDLIDDGPLTLDDAAGDHIEGLGGPASDATIRQLLLHTSGIDGEHGFDHVAMTKTDAVREISELWSRHKPGTDYYYNNTNYTILALIIDEVTEQGYRQYIVDEILFDSEGNPINAGWWDGEPSAQGPRAWGYASGKPALQRGEAEGPHWAMNGNGAMAMSPLEMAKWAQAFFDGHILSAAATEMFYDTWTETPGYRELAGWAHDLKGEQMGKPMLTTAGGGSGIGHEMEVTWLPEERQVIVVAQNASDIDLPNMAGSLWPSLTSGTGVPGPPAIEEIDSSTLSEVVGRYTVGDQGAILVEENSGALVARIEGTEAIKTFLKPDEEFIGKVDEHEQAVVEAFGAKLKDQNARRMERFEQLYGEFRGVKVDGTIQSGRSLDTLLKFEFASETKPGWAAVGVAGDLNYGVVDEPVDSWTTIYEANENDGREFVERYPQQYGPRVKLRLEDGGLVVDSSTAGITKLTKSQD